jgi:hypothetical protein
MRANRRIRTIIAAALVPVAALGVGLLGAGTASAAASGPSLMPDPGLYCAEVQNAPYVAQVENDGWSVLYTGVKGDVGKNDWACVYEVSMAVPVVDEIEVGDDSLNSSNLLLPPRQDTVPINWAAMCSQQYPGSSLQWIQAPATGVWGAPWQCVGQPGVTYNLVS